MLARKLAIDKLAPYADAVAGHDGVLATEDNELVIKPCTESEIAFYSKAGRRMSQLKTVIPLFYGTLAIANPETARALQENDTLELAQLAAQQQTSSTSASSPASPPTSVPSRGKRLNTGQAIVLENLAASFERPNIMDIKLGIRLWADDAPPEKRRKLDAVSAETTSGSLGLRVAGMKVWQPHLAHTPDEYKIYDKNYGRQFDERTIRQPFKEFLYERDPDGQLKLTPARRKVVEELLSEVRDIQKLLEKEETRMYSSSMLLIIEGDPDALERAKEIELEKEKKIIEKTRLARLAETVIEDDEEEKFVLQEDDEEEEEEEDEESYLTCSASLIDFAHAAFTPGLGPDENMLRGVRNVRIILDSMLRQP